MNVKDQSGVHLSAEWLRARGHGTYGESISGRRLMDMVSRPISEERFQTVVIGGVCVRCGGELRAKTSAEGGKYWACQENGHECYWLSGTYLRERITG